VISVHTKQKGTSVLDKIVTD